MARPMAHSGFSSRSNTPGGESFDASMVHHYRRENRYNDLDSERTPSPEEAQDMRRSRTPSPRARASVPRAYSHGAHGSARPYTPSGAQMIPVSKPTDSRSSSRAGMQKLGLGGYLTVERPALGRSPSSNRSELLGMIMAEEDRQLRSFQEANEALADRLDQEIRRADDAERRADRAENKLRDSHSRGQAHSTARQQAEVEVLRLQEEVKRYRMQLASAAKELQRAQAEIDILDQQRVDAEQSAVNARETARQYRTALEAQRAREEGLLEGRRLGIEESVRNYLAESGQPQLLLEAPKAPLAPPLAPRKVPDAREAYERGRAHGYDEGRVEGVQAEREQAFDAFGRFIADHEEELAPLAREQKSVVRPPRPPIYSSRSMPSNHSLGYAHDGASPSHPAESHVAAPPHRPYGSRAATRGTVRSSNSFSFADPETASRTVNGMFSRLLATVPGMDDDAPVSPTTTRDRERPIQRIPMPRTRQSNTDPEDPVSSQHENVHAAPLE